METVKGTVKKIIFQNEESGFKVIKVRLPSGPIITVTGEFGPEIVHGTIVNFHGDYKKHHKYGMGFRATSFTIEYNVAEMLSIELFLYEIAPYIGTERAHLIVKHFGSDTTTILDNESERLIEVEGIGKVSADSLALAWKKNRNRWKEERQDFALRAFLNTIGIRERRIKKILSYFGGGLIAEEKIRKNPYQLTGIEGFGFSTVDFVARKLGVPENDPQRLVAFIQYALNVLCPSNGHLYLTIEEVVFLINNFIRETNTSFLDKKSLNAYDILKQIKELLENGQIIKDFGSLYSKHCYLSETLSASKICNIINKKSDLITLDKETIDEHIIKFENTNNLTLSDEQRKALYYFREEKVYAITGLPGSGKTLILKAIVSLIKKLNLNLTCMAPTGISAKKMASTIGYDAYTIHRRLGFRGDSWVYGEDNKYETDVVIIDEISMIDMEVFYRLLSALKTRTHLILVGDNNQLPSVGAGNVLKEIINCGQIPIIKLEQIFRQDKASDIIRVAHRIKNGDTNLSLFKSNPKADVFFIKENDIEKIRNFLIKIAQKFKDERRLFQTITPRRDGPLSTGELNLDLQNTLNPKSPDLNEINCGKYILRKGDRIIITKNDYENDIFNGEVGKIISISSGRIEIQIDKKLINLSIDEIATKTQLAYSLTVHKCLHGKSHIFTQSGIKKLCDITKNDQVLTRTMDYHNVLWQGNTGINETLKIVTSFGFTIYSSPSHKFLLTNSKTEKFTKASKLKKGQYLCISRYPIIGQDIKLSWTNPIHNISGKSKRKSINLPPYLTEDLSWMLGALIGDGYYNKNEEGIISIDKPSSPEILFHFKSIIESLGLHVTQHHRNGELCSISVSSKNLREWLIYIGLNYTKAEFKKVPELIFKSNIKCRFAFISGIIDTNGTLSDKKIHIRSISFELISELQIILLSLGITSKISNENLNKNPLKLINIFGRNIKIIKENIKLYHKEKKTKLQNLIEIAFYETIPYGKSIINQIPFNQIIKKDKILISQLKEIKWGKKLSYNLLNRLKILLKENSINLPFVNKILDNNYFYDPVISIEKVKNCKKYDLKISKEPSYIANGFISHNSQGQEYPFIILPFINQYGKNMLQRNLLYTAITRAKEKVIVIGHSSAIEKAINNASVQKRNTNLGKRIELCLQKQKRNSLLIPHGEPVISPYANQGEDLPF